MGHVYVSRVPWDHGPVDVPLRSRLSSGRCFGGVEWGSRPQSGETRGGRVLGRDVGRRPGGPCDGRRSDPGPVVRRSADLATETDCRTDFSETATINPRRQLWYCWSRDARRLRCSAGYEAGGRGSPGRFTAEERGSLPTRSAGSPLPPSTPPSTRLGGRERQSAALAYRPCPPTPCTRHSADMRLLRGPSSDPR